MIELAQQMTHEDRIQRVCQVADEKFRYGADWVTFYREVLGRHGLVEQLFPRTEQKVNFQQTAAFAEIQQMLARLRARDRGQLQSQERTCVITIRLPQSLHEALRHEAHYHKTSLNKLCISKLLQAIDGVLVPSDFEQYDEQAPQPPRGTHLPPPVEDTSPTEFAAQPALAPAAAFTPSPLYSPLPTIASGS